MPISNIVCITPEPEDNVESFGSSVAINNKYIAVGDFIANHVVIYTQNNSDIWSRTKVILPPKDSVPDRVNYGFGKELQLDGNFLIISASVRREAKRVTNPEGFQRKVNHTYYFDERYLINLSSEAEVKPIGLAIKKSPGFLTFNLMSEGKIKQIKLSDKKDKSFGRSFAYYKNLLLVGSLSGKEESGAWLYHLEQLDQEPEKLAVPNTYIGETVALNEKFAAVGQIGDCSGVFRLHPEYMSSKPETTLIKNIKNGSTIVHPGIGKLSLSDNILARMRPLTPHLDCSGILEVFRLDQNAVPELIFTEDYVVNAFVQNSFLVITQNDYKIGHFKVCVHSIA